MSDDTGRAARGDEDELDEEDEEDEDFDPKEYETMLELERLESIEEEMADLGVNTLDDVRRRIRELHERLDRE